jgi:hypothetical protein
VGYTKQIQRYQNRQKSLRESHSVTQEQLVPVYPNQKPVNKFDAMLAVIGFMVALYFIYMEIEERSNNSKE